MIEYIEAKSIMSKVNEKAKEHWFSYDYNINLYRGCNHNCIYCDSRSDVYGIENFSSVKVKKDALLILEDELKRKRNKGVVGIGAMSDPYNALEKKIFYTRECLELLDKYGFGVCITTKSEMVLRDLDILKRIAEHSPVIVNITITCINEKLTKIIEPYASSTKDRFNAIKKLRNENIIAGILIMPILPYINDSLLNIKGLLKCAKEVDANYVYPWFGMSQRSGQREYYLNKLSEFAPEIRLKHEKRYQNQYSCPSDNHRELEKYLISFCRENDILYKIKDINEFYKKGYCVQQLTLF